MNCTEETVHKQPGRSLVWNHFIKSETPGVAVCRYCEKECKTTKGNTTSMRQHLTRYHKECMGDFVSRKQIKKSSSNFERYPFLTGTGNRQRFRRSSIWSHFNVDESNRTISCNNCGREFNSNANTSNLNSHLIGCTKRAGLVNVSPHGKKSFVWNHFIQTEIPKYAVCRYCNKGYRTCGNTSNLILHLKRKHGVVSANRTLSDPPMPDISLQENDDGVEPKTSGKQKRRKSAIWNYFQKKTKHTATCNYCPQHVTVAGGISSLRYHLMKYHKEEISSSSHGSSNTNNESGASYSHTWRKWSFAWRHFKRKDDPNRAVCNYCSKECNTTSGNTTGMRLHLKMHHPEKVTGEIGFFELRNKSRGIRSIRHSTFVWNHFEKDDGGGSAKCVHCEKTFVANGKMNNLYKHLVRRHKDKISPEKCQNEVDRVKRCYNRQNRSFVWNHFEKSHVPEKAVCNYCSKHFKTNEGTTSGLKTHLLNVHPEKVTNDLGELITTREENTVCAIDSVLDTWTHFNVCEQEEGTDNPRNALCVHCNEIVVCNGDTTNLTNHLIEHHKDEIKPLDDENDSKFLTNENTCDYDLLEHQYDISVWNHFQKDESNGVECVHCEYKLSTNGNITILEEHLKECHRNIINNERNEHAPNAIEQILLPKGSIDCETVLEEHQSFVKTANEENSEPPKNLTDEENNAVIDNGTTDVQETSESQAMDDILSSENETDLEKTHKQRSAVWSHFRVTEDPGKLICIHCEGEYNNNGKTSNIKRHLMRYHRDEAPDIDNESSQHSMEDPLSIPEPKVRSRKINGTPVWKYFEQSDIPDRALCLICKDLCDIGENSNCLEEHLIQYHKEIKHDNNEDKLGVSEQWTGRSFVWEHFDKIANSDKAICVYCKGEYCSSGNTTNLKNHIVRMHKDKVFPFTEDDGASNRSTSLRTQRGKQAESRKLPNDLVWKLIEQRANSSNAVCLLCKKEWSTVEDLKPLENHLIKYHNVKVTQDEDDRRLGSLSDSDDNEQPMTDENLPEDRKNVAVDDVENMESVEESLAFSPSNIQLLEVSELDDEIDEGHQRFSNKRNRSFVWNYFTKSRSLHKAICTLCHEEYSSSGNTTNLKDHLVRRHVDQLLLDGEDAPFSKTPKLEEDSIPDHFEKSATPNKVVCVYCKDECSVKNTAALKRHLLRFHRHQINTSDVETSIPIEQSASVKQEMTESVKDHHSFVWEHFRKISAARAVCLHCDEECNTSNLQYHLRRQHAEKISTNARPRAEVWNHFERGDTKDTATCNHCGKTYRTFGSTTNMRHHLARHHQDVLRDNEVENPVLIDEEKAARDVDDDININDLIIFRNAPKEKYHNRSTRSFVWDHFTKGKARTATCNHCGKPYKFSNTSNLKQHLVIFHKDVIEETPTTVTNEEESKVWEHFKNCRARHFAKCNHCAKLCRNNVTDLRAHLAKHHSEVSGEDAAVVEEAEMEDTLSLPGENSLHEEETVEGDVEHPEASERKTASFVSRHFTKTKVWHRVLCKYCEKAFNAFGNASFLRSHLVTFHKDCITGEEEFKDMTDSTPKGKLQKTLKPERVKARKSLVWNHFRKSYVPSFVVCNHCEKLCKHSGNTSNLWKHLTVQHGVEVQRSLEEKSIFLEEGGEVLVADEVDQLTKCLKEKAAGDDSNNADGDEYLILVVTQ